MSDSGGFCRVDVCFAAYLAHYGVMHSLIRDMLDSWMHQRLIPPAAVGHISTLNNKINRSRCGYAVGHHRFDHLGIVIIINDVSVQVQARLGRRQHF